MFVARGLGLEFMVELGFRKECWVRGLWRVWCKIESQVTNSFSKNRLRVVVFFSRKNSGCDFDNSSCCHFLFLRFLIWPRKLTLIRDKVLWNMAAPLSHFPISTSSLTWHSCIYLVNKLRVKASTNLLNILLKLSRNAMLKQFPQTFVFEFSSPIW